MAQFQWGSASGGLFNNLLGWLGGAVPGAGDTAVLGSLGAPYTVVSQAGVLGLPLGGTQAVGAIQTAAGSTLQVLGGIDLLHVLGGTTTFSAANGTGGGANAGTILVQNSQTVVPVLGTLLGGAANLQIGGTFNNTGAIVLNGLAPLSGLPIGDQTATLTAVGPTTLTGGGLVTLSAQAVNLVTGAAGAVITNVNNTVSGAGSLIGVALVNQALGVFLADQYVPMMLDGLGTTINQGVLEATKAGTLILKGDINNAGGTILAYGGKVILEGVSITDGSLIAANIGAFEVLGVGNTLTGGGLNGINLAGEFMLYAQATATFNGTFNNLGEVLIDSGHAANSGGLLIGSGGVILQGGGKVLLKGANSVIKGVTGGSDLRNLDNAILGSGLLGAGLMTLINGVKGVILGTSPIGLTIDTGSNTIDNAGAIGASRGGLATVVSAVNNTGILESLGGTLNVLGAVTGAGQGLVKGGTLAFASGFAENVTFQRSGVLQLAQSRGYTGTVSGFSKTGSTALDLRDIGFTSPGEATYAGTAAGGVLTVTDGTHTAHIALTGNYLGSTFTAAGDGHGGTTIIDHAGAGASVAVAPAHHFIAAAAALGAPVAGSAGPVHAFERAPAPTLARPAAMTA